MSMELTDIDDIYSKINVLQERLVSFYAIHDDIECPEAREVIMTQIDNYRSALEVLQDELLRKDPTDPSSFC